LAVLLEPVDRVHPDVAWSPASPGATSSTPAAGHAGSTEPPAAAGHARSAAPAGAVPAGPGLRAGLIQPVGRPARVLQPLGRDALLGSAVARLHLQHHDAAPAAAQ